MPVLLLLGTTGEYKVTYLPNTPVNVLPSATMVACGGMLSSVDTPSNLPTAYNLIYTCGAGLSLLTNIVITSLIVYKLWWVYILGSVDIIV